MAPAAGLFASRRVQLDGEHMVDAVTLRKASDADADAIRTLTREAYSKWIAVIGREPLPMTVDYAAAIKKHRFDLLYADGCLAAVIETVPKGDFLLIENVAVAPSLQGRGFGKRLLKHAEDLAASSGLKGTRLYTNKLFSANLCLYEALGYQTEREEELNGGVAVHMSKACARNR
jgi:N-acetylglutamate synthase-like GNAT family acetyltransferase